MKSHKSAFTMIEMVFVIVVLGILAGIAIPKFVATRTDATIAKGRSDVASIRTGISTERQKRFMKGMSSYIPNGTNTYTVDGNVYNQMDHNGLFGGILTYPISNVAGKDGQWSAAAGTGSYVYRVAGTTNTFIYNSTDGTFNCTTGTYCDKLTK